MNLTLQEQLYFQKVLDPVDNTSAGAATVPSSYIDVSDMDRFAFLLSIGNMTGTLDAQVVQATAAAGTGSKNITGAVITQLGASDDNKQVLVEVEVAKLDINNDFRYVAITLTEASSTAQLADAWFIGVPKSAPVTQHADIDETVFVGG